LVLDELPDDASHLVAIEFNDRADDLDPARLAHALLQKTWGKGTSHPSSIFVSITLPVGRSTPKIAKRVVKLPRWAKRGNS
jgi:hypothetical protein